MISFRVWIRPLGDNCRVRVDGLGNAQWLLARLGTLPAIRTIGQVDVEIDVPRCTFLVPYHAALSPATFQQLLKAIPEVQLMLEPA
jgi:hypothetical protein